LPNNNSLKLGLTELSVEFNIWRGMQKLYW